VAVRQRWKEPLVVKLVALFTRPDDPAAFDEAYFGTHLPLNAKTPGLRRVEVSRVTGAPRGETPYYLMAEMYYDSEEAMRAGLASSEAAEAARDLMSFAKGLVTMFTAEVKVTSGTEAPGTGDPGLPA
jgi:uncharacterized protein (TIGR02118 family)